MTMIFNKHDRYPNFVHEYNTNDDPDLNFCWNKMCVLIFEAPAFRKEHKRSLRYTKRL